MRSAVQLASRGNNLQLMGTEFIFVTLRGEKCLHWLQEKRQTFHRGWIAEQLLSSFSNLVCVFFRRPRPKLNKVWLIPCGCYMDCITPNEKSLVAQELELVHQAGLQLNTWGLRNQEMEINFKKLTLWFKDLAGMQVKQESLLQFSESGFYFFFIFCVCVSLSTLCFLVWCVCHNSVTDLCLPAVETGWRGSSRLTWNNGGCCVFSLASSLRSCSIYQVHIQPEHSAAPLPQGEKLLV